MLEKSKRKSQGNHYDRFVKKMFGRILVFVDFLLHYADQRFISEIDLTKINSVPTHYVGKSGDERIADLVFECPFKDSEDASSLLVIVFEHQNRNLKHVPEKLLKYISAIWDAELKAGKKYLSVPYFIVLRTAKKPHRGRFPVISDSCFRNRL